MRAAFVVAVVMALTSFEVSWTRADGSCELGTWRTIGGTARRFHHAVWTGEEMIVWGGRNAQNQYVNTGERYNPATGVVTGISTIGAPSPRAWGAVVWTGTHMLVWGGAILSGGDWVYYNDGALYDPTTDTWTPMSPIGAPSARRQFAYGWSGTEFLVHGGYGEPSSEPPPTGYFNCERTLQDAVLYDPSSDTWGGYSTTGPQVGEHGAIWTGDGFLVVGGKRQIYSYYTDPNCFEGLLPERVAQTFDPLTGQWTNETESGDGVPADLEPRLLRGGGEVFVFGGGFLGDFPIRFDPSTSTWTPITPSAFSHFYVVWADGLVYLWLAPDESGVWNPLTDRWAPLSANGAPFKRWEHTLIWTGEEMIVWGGRNASGTTVFSGGAAYRPNDPDGDGLAGPCDLCPNGDMGFDSDGDGFGDPCDNCPAEANPTQQDLDADQLGDVCDPCALDPQNDIDTDGWCANEDNCPDDANIDQSNDDGDPFGNACDRCPTLASPENTDSDDDGLGDVCDNCPFVANPTQDDDDRELVRQWAVTALASSEWTDTDWSATQATGPPEMNFCSSVETNWSPLEGGFAPEWLEVGYATSTQAIGVDVVNSGLQSGFVQRIELIDPDGGLRTIWDDADPSACGETPSLRWNQTPYEVSAVVVHTQIDGWEEIDAVELLGLGGPQNDLVGSACDVCPFIDDPLQTDSDSDGAGDLCDCAPNNAMARQPSEVYGLSVSAPAPGVARISWRLTAGADEFAVRRGLLSTVAVGQYGECIADLAGATQQFTDAELPPPGDGFTYLIQGRDSVCGLGTLGTASNGLERIQVTPGDCL